MSIFKRNTEDSSLPNELAPSLSETVQDPEVERGLPQNLSSNKKSNVKKALLAVIGVIGLALIFSGLMLIKDTPKPVKEEVSEAVSNKRPRDFSSEQQKLLSQFQAPELDPEPKPDTSSTEEPLIYKQKQPVPPPPKPNGVAEPEEPRRELQGNVLVSLDTASRGSSSTDSPHITQGRETSLSEQLRPTVTLPGQARKRADLTYLLAKGTGIACTLNTKIVTTQPGITRCIVNKDVYSKNGKILLIERGSEVIGEQTSALIHGQARVFVLWNTIETPAGVSVEIHSPTADSLGASGQAAHVETHFWQRFSGAIMLSMIDDVLGIAANTNRSRDQQYQFDKIRDSTKDMAAIALENTINIPPTGYVNQGSLVNIMVARDVDFSDIYKLVNSDWTTWQLH